MSDLSPSDTSEIDPADVRPPRTVVAAFVAVCVQVAMGILGSLLLFGAADYIRREVILKGNSDAAAKKKTLPYDLTKHDIAYYVHQYQTSSLISSLLFGAIFVLLAVLFWRGRGWARWVLIIAAIVTQQPFRVLLFGSNTPGGLKATIVLGGAASLVSIVLLLLPETNRYFAAKRGAPPAGAAAAPGAFNLRTLFMPRAAQRADVTNKTVERKEPAARPRTQVVRPPAPEPETTASTADVAAPRAKAKARVAPTEPAATKPAGKPRNKAKGR